MSRTPCVQRRVRGQFAPDTHDRQCGRPRKPARVPDSTPPQSARPAAGEPQASRLRYAMSGTGWYVIGRTLFTGHASESTGGERSIASGCQSPRCSRMRRTTGGSLIQARGCALDRGIWDIRADRIRRMMFGSHRKHVLRFVESATFCRGKVRGLGGFSLLVNARVVGSDIAMPVKLAPALLGLQDLDRLYCCQSPNNVSTNNLRIVGLAQVLACAPGSRRKAVAVGAETGASGRRSFSYPGVWASFPQTGVRLTGYNTHCHKTLA